MDEDFFYQNFNTPLAPEEEAKFQAWAADASRKRGRDLLMDLYDYDLRGFWKAGASTDERLHGSDQWKKPNHPTFSDESQYHGATAPDGSTFIGGHWQGENFTPPFVAPPNSPAQAPSATNPLLNLLLSLKW